MVGIRAFIERNRKGRESQSCMAGNVPEIEGAEFQSLWWEYEPNKEIKIQNFNLYVGNTSLRRICKDSA